MNFIITLLSVYAALTFAVLYTNAAPCPGISGEQANVQGTAAMQQFPSRRDYTPPSCCSNPCRDAGGKNCPDYCVFVC